MCVDRACEMVYSTSVRRGDTSPPCGRIPVTSKIDSLRAAWLELAEVTDRLTDEVSVEQIIRDQAMRERGEWWPVDLAPMHTALNRSQAAFHEYHVAAGW
jgi:hypothetical protein